jgi:DNA-binding FadR family transcriptional regulator
MGGTGQERAYQKLVDHVERAIGAGELSPGDRLPSERELAEQFHIGRSSVREALRVLESMELVRSQPRDHLGPQVLPASTRPLRRSVEQLTSSRLLTLAELVEFRMVVDAAANLIAASRRTAAHLAAMERNIARMNAAMSIGYDEFSRSDMEFHEIVAQAAGNTLLQVYGDVTRQETIELIRRTIMDSDDRTTLMLQSLQHHRAVYSAIESGDGLLASRLAREALYAYYADRLEAEDRRRLAELVLEVGGRA